MASTPTTPELVVLGMPASGALKEITALFAHAIDLLVLGHTGRIRMFKQGSLKLFNTYVERLVHRAVSTSRR